MNPWVTEYNISDEYDGFVLTKGVSMNLGLNSFTFGIALGWDHLLDRNREYWIYQGKPWLGLYWSQCELTKKYKQEFKIRNKVHVACNVMRIIRLKRIT